MQKLSKELIKKLVYEAIQKQDVSVKGDYKGKKTPEEIKALEDAAEDPEDIKVFGITKESIDRIIREEVQAYYGAK
jgi:hypothetical protein